MAMIERSSVVGLRVNITPATSASTACWTQTLMPTVPTPCPRDNRAREDSACGEKELAQHRRTASSTSASPRTHRYVSCCPAQLASEDGLTEKAG